MLTEVFIPDLCRESSSQVLEFIHALEKHCRSYRVVTSGKSGIIFDQQRKDLGFRSALTGFVETPDLKDFLHRRDRLGMHQPAMYAFMSTREALAMAMLDADYMDKMKPE